MSATLENAAEILKLERLLGVDAGAFAFLEGIDPGELRTLREKATDSLFDAGASMMARLAAAAKLTPSPIVATIAERSFGPLLCARAAGSVDPAKAIDVAKRLSPTFLADATVELDPRRVARIIAGVPVKLVEPVARELGRREEHVTMGRFLAFVSDEAIVAAMGALSDEAMLRTAFVLEHKDKLDHAVGLLPAERLPGVLTCASENDLWPEALDLLDHLSPETRGPIADVVAALDEDLVARLVAAVSAAGIWESLLPVVGTMSDQGRLLIASRPAFHDQRVLTEIVDAAATGGRFWSDLLPLIEALPDDVRGRAADLIADQDPAVVAGLIASVRELDLWATLLPVVRTMSEDSRTTLAAMPCFHESAVITDIVSASVLGGLWVDLVPLLRVLPAEVVTAVIDGADRSLGELLVTTVTDPAHIRLLLDHVPADVLAAVERAADRLGLRAEFDAAIEGSR